MEDKETSPGFSRGFTAPGSLQGLKESSLNPPHLLDTFGNTTHSALIPFCAYKSDMSITGEYIESRRFPVCTKFQPTIQDGQLCYVLNINKVLEVAGGLGRLKTASGKNAGILLLVDPVKPADDHSTTENDLEGNNMMRIERSQDIKNSARIYISTLASFSDNREGSYAMSDLKKMTGTSSFLDLPDEKKSCQIEALEACRSRRYLAEVEKQCGCIPWSLSGVLTQQLEEVILYRTHFSY